MNKNLIIYKAHDSRFADHENQLYETLESYARSCVANSKFEICFAKCNPTIKKSYFDADNKTFWVAASENYANAMRQKVLESLEYFFCNTEEYQNVFVTNLSTIVNNIQLERACNTEYDIQAVKGFYSWPIRLDQNQINYFFPSGAGMLINADTVRKIIKFSKQKNLENCPNFDDTFIGYCLHELDIDIKPLNRLDLATTQDCINAKNTNSFLNYSHIRIKTQDGQDFRDTDVEQKISKYIYEKIYYTENS